MQHYDVILFDVDGTLIDSAPGILNTLEEVFRKMDVDITGVDLRRYLGPPLRKTFAEHFTDPAKVEEAAGLYRASYAVKGSHECRVFPGAAEMLRRLKEAGFVLCTATSKPTQVVTPILRSRALPHTSISSAGLPWMRAATPRPRSSATCWSSPAPRVNGS